MLPTDKQWDDIVSKIRSTTDNQFVNGSVSDLFALGCYLHLNGEKTAGYHSADLALKSIGLHQSSKTLYLNILDHLEGNQSLFALKVKASFQINQLFK